MGSFLQSEAAFGVLIIEMGLLRRLAFDSDGLVVRRSITMFIGSGHDKYNKEPGAMKPVTAIIQVI